METWDYTIDGKNTVEDLAIDIDAGFSETCEDFDI